MENKEQEPFILYGIDVDEYLAYREKRLNEQSNEQVLRKQITTILIGHANDIGESDFADGKQHKKITNKAVDAVFSLITGETK